MQLYNTLTRQKELFAPMNPPFVTLYACGVTVYDYCHLGHARIYTAVDTMVRYLRFAGYQVKYVRNITDIDDKIIKRANESGKAFEQVTMEFIQAMHDDFHALGILKPDLEPRATEYIPQMLALIQRLIAQKHAYLAANGDVYFDVRSFKAYGALSHCHLDDLESGARVEVGVDKRDPLDFVLWKAAKPNEPAWESPFGSGRPGWHIECSAMAMDLLGEEFDIHIGGQDLIFPHHENEIAQSCAASGKAFAYTWLHGGFLQIDQEKMSKSLGNFVTIRDILRVHSAEALRYVLVASHYRSQLIYTESMLDQAKQSLTRLYQALRFIEPVDYLKDSYYEAQFKAAMDDDFNTPIALSVLFELAHEVQRLRDVDFAKACAHAALLKHLAGILGLLQQDPEAFFQSGLEVDVAWIEEQMAARQAARAEKNWQEADRIRDQLLEQGIVIEDTAKGASWRKMTK